jgi:hypothetical protein
MLKVKQYLLRKSNEVAVAKKVRSSAVTHKHTPAQVSFGANEIV